MGHVWLTLLLVCLWLLEGGHSGWAETPGEPHAEFAVSLYRSLSATDNNSNLIVSPLSVSMSLGLLQFGARGRTRAQLEEALKYNVNGKRQRRPRQVEPGAAAVSLLIRLQEGGFGVAARLRPGTAGRCQIPLDPAGAARWLES
ncbi:serpin E3 isoform X3 [Arapaima gigas]